MLRSSRTIAALLKHLVLGTASVTAIVATTTVLVGCEDESQPDYWVKRLEDPAKRPAAVKRLTQFYEDGLTKANQNRDTPEMKELLAKIVKPMADAYVKGDLDEKTRVELLKALANTRDPGAKDAIIKAMKDFAAGKATADEMTVSAGYVKQLKLQEAAGALIDGFEKVNPSKKELGTPYIAVKEAMLTIPDPSWTQRLIDIIGKPVDPKNKEDMQEKIYHQTVAIQVLGDLKAANAVKPIFKVLVTPDKGPVGISPVVALAKIGKAATVPLIDIMTGKDTETVEYSRKMNPGDAGKSRHVATAALVLGNIGRGEALTPMIAALLAADNDETRGVIGREMAGLPASPDAIKALEAAYEKVAPDSTIPPGDFTRKILSESAGRFMDSSMVPWLLKQVDAMARVKAEKEVIDAIQIGLLQTAMKLMKADQVDDVKRAVDKEGTDLEKQAFQRAADVVKACTDKVACYLGKIEDPKVQEQNEQFTGIKAAYMLGMLGNDSTKAEIVKRLQKIKAVAIRGTAVLAIDHLSPNGDVKTADDLQKIDDEDAKRNPEEGAKLNGVIKQVTPRLRARAS